MDIELDQAEKDNDQDLIDDIKEKKMKIDDYLKKSTYNGRPRKSLDDGERRRQAIHKAIKGVFNKIQKKHSELYDHLDKCIKIGYNFFYKPYPKIRWLK